MAADTIYSNGWLLPIYVVLVALVLAGIGYGLFRLLHKISR